MGKDINKNFDTGKLLFCGYEDCAPGHSFGPAAREYCIIHYITGGKGVFCDGKEKYNLKAGDGFLIVPSRITTYRADDSHPWAYSWVAFDGGGIEKYLNDAGINEENPVFNMADSAAERCFAEMRECFEKGGNDCTILSCMYRFLGMLVDRSGRASVQKGYAERAAEFMKYNFYAGINVNDAARFVGIDRSYLSKLFAENIGISPAEYLLKLRMDEAARLMKNMRLRISDISATVGYSDQFVFSKAFSKYFGIPPSDYRRKCCADM